MAGNKQGFVLGVPIRDKMREREMPVCIAQEGQEVFPILAKCMQCSCICIS